MTNEWIEQIFKSRQAHIGGIVRRSVMSVKRFATIKELRHAVASRGFHMVRNGDQFVIFLQYPRLEDCALSRRYVWELSNDGFPRLDVPAICNSVSNDQPTIRSSVD